MSAPDRNPLPPASDTVSRVRPLAPREQTWRDWAARKFPDRGYLALQAAETPTDAMLTIDLVQAHRGLGRDAVTAVIAIAGDGSVEFSRAQADAHNYNGADGAVEARDAEFYGHAARAVTDRGGVLLQAAAGDRSGPGRRLFQDACVAVFPNADGELAATAAALELHRRLADLALRTQPKWADRLHARVVVGRTWEDVLPCLRLAWRDETVVEGRVWDAFGDDLRSVLFAAGVRRGGRRGAVPAAAIPRRPALAVSE